ncbi:MAG: type III pantothenate kinase [Lentisphaeria bacterium]|jgi:type III pantothenate kinase
MKLLIDVGNTRVKWIILNERGQRRNGAICRRGLDVLACDLSEQFQGNVMDEAAVSQVYVASVAGAQVDQLLTVWVRDMFAVDALFAQVKRSCSGVSVGYEKLESFGVDRWLALMAARQQERGPCVVIDAGSAITVDYLDADGVHGGGLIVPGVSMMARALFSNTMDVKVGALTLPQLWRPEYDTLSCVENGVFAMIKGFLCEVLGHSGKAAPSVLLAGGDAASLKKMLDQGASGQIGGSSKLRVRVCRDLVLDGLLLADWK